MPDLPGLLVPATISLSDILLDPNNPRFAELGQPVDAVPEARFAEKRVQDQAYDRMKTPRFDVSELRDTIKNLGFLPMDRIVVRRWHGPEGQQPQKYVVIEGNRRVAALKWLLELNETGRETFDEDQIRNFTELQALVLDDDNAPENVRWILPGLRHVSGIKEWGPYQKAKAIFELRESGMSAQVAAQSLGLSTRAANQSWRSFLALEQMGADEEYGEYVQPNLYSYFEEALKRPNVKDWLDWNDEQRGFRNEQHLKEFYGWMLGELLETGDLGEPKLPEAKSVRDLGRILEDANAMAVFTGPGGTLTRALARFEAEHPQEWLPAVANAQTVLASLSPDNLRALGDSDLAALRALSERIERVLEDRRRLLGESNG
ncbi:MAG: hypothetical protein ACLPND_21475 [Candidatus Korobacteraceae bacterium]